ncbi:MAG TPA: hypothetical protein PK095_13360 [Myxococcota bacterium]|nr:hypothetical protein [Myxococcota bacterium]
MTHRTHRFLLVMFAMVVIAGSSGAPAALAEAPQTRVQLIPRDFRAPDKVVFKFTLEQVTVLGPGFTVEGKSVPPNTVLIGLIDAAGNRLAPAEFVEFIAPNSKVFFLRRWSDRGLTRVRLDGSEPPEPLDLHEVHWPVTNDRNNNHGIVPTGPGKRPIVVVFDDDWREGFRLDDVDKMVVPPELQHVSYNLFQDWPVERTAGGDVLAHHVDPDGKRFSRFYDLRGNPLGPPLPQLFRIPTGETSRRYVFPTADGLFWPISHTGSPEPLPREVLGVIPLVSRAQWYLTYLDRVEGWAIKAQTRAGVRWGLVADLDGLLERGIEAVDLAYDALSPADDAPQKWNPFHFAIKDPLLVLRSPGEARFALFAFLRKGAGLVRIMPELDFAAPAEAWAWAHAVSLSREQVFMGEVKQRQQAEAAEKVRARDAERTRKKARFEQLAQRSFVAPESAALARELGGGYFARWCLVRCKRQRGTA